MFAIILAFWAAPTAHADTLKCWNTYSKRGAVPTIVADVVSDQELNNFAVNTKPDDFTSHLKTPEGAVRGELIISNRSPYKNNREFDLAGARLILPAQLDNANLLRAQEGVNGFSPGENGVVIGSFHGDGAGSHFSVRLRCRAYQR